MSRRSPRGSIDRKLTLTVVVVTAVSLLSACLAFATYDVITLRDSMTREASTLAEVVGINSAAALAFHDRAAATETLGGLSAAGSVLAAWIYDREGGLFATYASPSAPPQSAPRPPTEPHGHRFRGAHIDCHQTISLGDEVVGRIQLRFDTSALGRRVEHYTVIVVMLLLAASGVAMVFATRLRRRVARPLAELADGSEAIAGGDLSIRVASSADDEIGVLARAFNAMTEGLREVVSHVRGSIAEVSEISRGLRQSGSQMADEADRQRTAIADTAESLEQVGSSLVAVGSSVEGLASFAQDTSASMLDLDTSIADIAEHMDRLAHSIETTSAASNQVAVNVEEVVGGVETLRAATDEASLRLDQLGRSVGQVKENAKETRELAEDSHQEASEGMSAVMETISAMRQIEGSFGELELRVSQLATRSRSIDEIIHVIEDVAEQTTLLSLNAAIIAAQAGEHGKAFSVVSDEVKTLADRTQRSTREIALLTRGVQGDTEAAVAAVEAGSARVRRGVECSNVAGDVLRKILEKSQNSAARVGSISEAAGEQSGDLERLEGAMRDVERMVERIRSSAREQQRATGSIAEAVQEIRDLGGDVRRSTDEERRRSRLVAEASSDVSEKIQHIARAAQAQAASRETIQRALQIFGDVTEETARRSEAINAMVETLLERSRQLEREIDRFKTD